MDKDEMDMRSVLRASWRKLVDFAEEVTDRLSEVQGKHKKRLVKDIKDFTVEVAHFRNDFTLSGPMVIGIKPAEAVSRLRRFMAEFELRARKLDVYRSGEDLFALKATAYPDLAKTEKELKLLDQLYGLYISVEDALDDVRGIAWVDINDHLQTMEETFVGFDQRCRKLPMKLREWPAFKDCRKHITDFQDFLPIITQLCKESVKPRHWTEITQVASLSFSIDSESFKLAHLMDSSILDQREAVEEICDGADKQLGIESKLVEIKEKWSATIFTFAQWKTRDVPILRGFGSIIEDLEDSQMQAQSMLSMRHVAPFREEVAIKLAQLSETVDILERWIKVQKMIDSPLIIVVDLWIF
jgi:dynein heavy chain